MVIDVQIPQRIQSRSDISQKADDGAIENLSAL
jgi:hypothetical protein